jgi:branched-chain amino acid transport system permease protein
MLDWILILLIHLCFLILLGVSFNLTAGYLGLTNVATAAIFGVGANITAALTTGGWNFFAALPLSIAGGACAGALTGLPSLRVKGLNYLMVSIGFQLLLHDVFKNSSLMGNKEGVRDIPFPSLAGLNFSSTPRYFLLSLLAVISVILFTWRLTNSAYGRQMRGIRENELLLTSLGKNVNRVKLQTFAIGGAIAALGGSLYAAHTRFVSYESFGLDLSIKILVVTVMGGLGRLLGPALGASFAIFVPEILRALEFDSAEVLIIERMLYASALLLLLWFRPRGLVESCERLLGFRRYFMTPSAGRFDP